MAIYKKRCQKCGAKLSIPEQTKQAEDERYYLCRYCRIVGGKILLGEAYLERERRRALQDDDGTLGHNPYM